MPHSSDDLAAALEELREHQARIREASDQMMKVTGSSKSADRIVTATVDARGRLVDLKLSGTRYRKMAPAELCARIVEAVQAAQDQAAEEASRMLNGLLPAGLGMPAVGEELDLDAIFEAAVSAAAGPMFTGDTTSPAEKGDKDG